MPKVGVLLSIESATPAKNVAIMRSIVEVIKRVSSMGEVEQSKRKQEARVSKLQAPLNH